MASKLLSVKRRLFFLLVMFSVICLLLIIRIGWLQLYQGAELQKKAFEQQIQNRVVNARRGIIYDRNGKPLAVSTSVDEVSVVPAEIKKPDEVAKKLSEFLGMEEEKVKQTITSNVRFVVVKRRIEKAVGDKIREWIYTDQVEGVKVDEDIQREYTYENLASHIIGFTDVDNHGLDGIEKTMEKYLRGVPGRIISESDVKGRAIPFKTERYINPQEGYNVVLTIDEVIQHFAEQALETAIIDNKAESGGVAIVMDPKTGEVLALASKPDYDLNKPREMPKGFDEEQWKALDSAKRIEVLQKTYWRNKAVVDTYEPGSTFKIITSAAGLEEGLVKPDDPFTCVGHINVAGTKMNCWRYYRPHGLQTFSQGVQNSCNPVFIEVGQRLGPEKFYKYIKAFGFGEQTGIDVPWEEPGIFHRLKDVGPVELATISFGQRFQITPMQMITAVSAVANGGRLIRPRLVKELTDSNNEVVVKYEPVVVRQAISNETSATLRSILESVVKDGTGRNAYVRGYRVAGKTGTSEKGVNTGKYIASFVGFAPADDPAVCVLVMLDEPNGPSHMGGVIAAPVVGKIIEDTLKYMEVEPKFTESDQIVMETLVPDVKGKTLSQAKKAILEANLTYKVEGNANGDPVIFEQTPKMNARLAEKSVVILYTYKPEQETMVKVPNLITKNISEATQAASEAFLNISATGVGSAIKQKPAAGTMVPKGSVIEVDFKHLDVD